MKSSVLFKIMDGFERQIESPHGEAMQLLSHETQWTPEPFELYPLQQACLCLEAALNFYRTKTVHGSMD